MPLSFHIMAAPLRCNSLSWSFMAPSFSLHGHDSTPKRSEAASRVHDEFDQHLLIFSSIAPAEGGHPCGHLLLKVVSIDMFHWCRIYRSKFLTLAALLAEQNRKACLRCNRCPQLSRPNLNLSSTNHPRILVELPLILNFFGFLSGYAIKGRIWQIFLHGKISWTCWFTCLNFSVSSLDRPFTVNEWQRAI